MKRVLLDVNVVLDVLLDRAPFADASSAVWAAVEQGEAEGVLSAHAVTTLHYLNAKAVGARLARNPGDFKGASVKALTPSEALAWLAASR